MTQDYLLAGVFGAVILSVIGYWCYRYPHKAWVVGTELGWIFGSYILVFYLVDRITSGGPKWVQGIGTLAVVALWIGVVVPPGVRRLVRRLGP